MLQQQQLGGTGGLTAQQLLELSRRREAALGQYDSHLHHPNALDAGTVQQQQLSQSQHRQSYGNADAAVPSAVDLSAEQRLLLLSQLRQEESTATNPAAQRLADALFQQQQQQQDRQRTAATAAALGLFRVVLLQRSKLPSIQRCSRSFFDSNSSNKADS